MKITEVEHETRDSVTLTFRGDEKLVFKPGQFVMVQLLKGTEELPKRAYSISSSPERNYLQITVKEKPDGYVSKLLNQVKVGDELIVEGPFGHFVFDEEKMPNVVLIGAGSGIAPLRSICQYVNDKKLGTKVTFLYSNKTEGDIIFKDDLKKMAGENKKIDLCLTLTREKKEGFTCGRIDETMLGKIIDENPGAQYFLCGPIAMVKCMQEIIYAKGIEKEKVKSESYG